jgi:pyoverdine/dityrosine biosynthesis protein Dit1
VNVLAFAPNAQTVFAERFVIAPGKKVNVSSEGRQFSAIIKTDCSRADDRNAKIWKFVA